MKLFYARVSTEEQNESRQLKQAEEQKADKIFIDKKSGKNTDREQLKEMLAFCREGDIIYCESISRIARNTKDFLNIMEELNSKNVQFVSLKENIDTGTATGKFMLTVFSAIAELERDSILQRQREGIALAKANGKYKGRQPKDRTEFRQLYREWKAGERTAVSIMRKLGITQTTFYRWVKEEEKAVK